MRVSAKIFGLDKFTKAMDKYKEDVEKHVIQSVQYSALTVHSEAIKSIQKIKGSEKQVRYSGTGSQRVVTVSPAGQPPNTDTGVLVSRIKFEFEDEGKTAYVGTDLGYGASLEFGTSNMAARPWLSTAILKTQDKILTYIRKLKK